MHTGISCLNYDSLFNLPVIVTSVNSYKITFCFTIDSLFNLPVIVTSVNSYKITFCFTIGLPSSVEQKDLLAR